MVKKSNHKPLMIWLLGCAGMIFFMAVIGAITRLTESGLSIVDWKVISGALPPLSKTAWLAEFQKYQQIPEYKLTNLGMSLADFKNIYWWEYIHRLWGRLIGLVYGLPLLIFWIKNKIPSFLKPHLLILLALGAAQGYVGWWMVKSGLTQRIDVSQYRLAAHLSIALVIYGYMIWLALGLKIAPPKKKSLSRFRPYAVGILVLVALTIIAGAFVAGMNAGLIYNTWPSMNGQMVPTGLWVMSPWWLNFFENATTIQFVHRWLAQTTVLVIFVFGYRVLRENPPKQLKLSAIHMIVMALVQLMLGIKTLLFGVPIWLAAAHQAGALLLLFYTIWTIQSIPKAKSK